MMMNIYQVYLIWKRRKINEIKNIDFKVKMKNNFLQTVLNFKITKSIKYMVLQKIDIKMKIIIKVIKNLILFNKCKKLKWI